MGNAVPQLSKQICGGVSLPAEEVNAVRHQSRYGKSNKLNTKRDTFVIRNSTTEPTPEPMDRDEEFKTMTHLPSVSYSLFMNNPERVRKAKSKNHQKNTLSVTKWVPDDVFRRRSTQPFESNQITRLMSHQHTIDSLDDLNHSQISSKPLLIIGQGTVELKQTIPSPFTITITNDEDTMKQNYIQLKVERYSANILFFNKGKGIRSLCQTKHANKTLQTKGKIACAYWISFSDGNKFIKYGIGELREKTTQLEYKFTKQSDKILYNFINVANCAKLVVKGHDYAWRIHRDAVVYEPPVAVIDNHKITMDHIHNESYTVAQNLPRACGQLYYNVYGNNFTIDTEDFPQFTQAIEESIRNPNGWCFKKLKEKASGFGHTDPKGTYLRITLGRNHCNSPGVPFVLEIWPCGHYSPIHNHADAHAIIRVLYGEIEVSLYPFLSPFMSEPHTVKRFKQGDITYITNGLNQTHKLMNQSKHKTAITIQCYQYGDDDDAHYEYFDYINKDKRVIEQFDPVADLRFGEFKDIMKKEYQNSHS